MNLRILAAALFVLVLLHAAPAQLTKAPAIDSITPVEGYSGQAGFTLAVSGFNFTASSRVTWNGAQLPTTYISPTQLSAVVGASLLTNNGTSDVTVVVAVVDTTVPTPLTTVTFTLHPNQFAINRLDPPSFVIATGANFLTLRVLGGVFDSNMTVLWNGSPRTTNFINQSELDVIPVVATDVATPGTAQVSVRKADGTTTPAATVAIVPGQPILGSLDPQTVGAGAAAFPLTVSGSLFFPGATVLWNGSPRSTTYISKSQMTATIAAADVASPGTVQVRVQQNGYTSDPLSFTVTATPPTPVVTSLSPTQVTAGSGAFTLTVHGANFAPGATVYFYGGTAPVPTTFASSNQLTAAIPDVLVASPYDMSVCVRNSGSTVNSNCLMFFVLGALTPVPGCPVTPNHIYQGAPGFTLTVNGASFQPGAQVTFRGSPRATTFIDSTQLTAEILAGDLTQTGTFTGAIGVTQGGATASSPCDFTVDSMTPTVTSITPNTIESAQSVPIIIIGVNFISGATALFNGSPRSTAWMNATRLRMRLSNLDIRLPGTYPITVQQPSPPGGTSNAVNLTINNPAPQIYYVSPGVVDANSGALALTLRGIGFCPQSSVLWNGSPRTTTFVSSSTLTVNVLASDVAVVGAYPITVVNPAPGGGTTPNAVKMQVSTPGTFPLPILQYIPHIIWGGGFVTKLTLTNLTQQENTVTTWYLSPSGSSTKTITYTLPPAWTYRFETSAGTRWDPLTVQWWLVNVQSPRQASGAPNLGINLFFEYSTEADSVAAYADWARGDPPKITNAVGFNDVTPLTAFVLPVEVEPAPPGASIGKTVGLALANSSSSATVTLKLVGRRGNLMATKTQTLAPYQQVLLSLQDANSCPEFAAVLPNGNFLGTLVVSSTSPVAAIALLDDYGQFSATPVVPVATPPR